MYEKLTLAISTAALATSGATLAVIGYGLHSAGRAMRSTGKAELPASKAELAVRMPGGATRYVCSDGSMRDEPPDANASPERGGNVIPLFGPIGGEM